MTMGRIDTPADVVNLPDTLVAGVQHGGPDAGGVPVHDFSTNSNACGPCPEVLCAVQRADPVPRGHHEHGVVLAGRGRRAAAQHDEARLGGDVIDAGRNDLQSLQLRAERGAERGGGRMLTRERRGLAGAEAQEKEKGET